MNIVIFSAGSFAKVVVLRLDISVDQGPQADAASGSETCKSAALKLADVLPLPAACTSLHYCSARADTEPKVGFLHAVMPAPHYFGCWEWNAEQCSHAVPAEGSAAATRTAAVQSELAGAMLKLSLLQILSD